MSEASNRLTVDFMRANGSDYNVAGIPGRVEFIECAIRTASADVVVVFWPPGSNRNFPYEVGIFGMESKTIAKFCNHEQWTQERLLKLIEVLG